MNDQENNAYRAGWIAGFVYAGFAVLLAAVIVYYVLPSAELPPDQRSAKEVKK